MQDGEDWQFDQFDWVRSFIETVQKEEEPVFLSNLVPLLSSYRWQWPVRGDCRLS